MSAPLSDDQLAAVQAQLLRGAKIEAIKVHREASGMGLAESKAFVEQVEAELRAKRPGEFATRAAGPGCGVLVAVVLVAGAIVAAVVWAFAK